MFNRIVQDPEKASSTGGLLAYRVWHRVNRREEVLTEGGRGGRGRATGRPSAAADGGRAAISLTPDSDGTHICISESSQFEGAYEGDLLYFPSHCLAAVYGVTQSRTRLKRLSSSSSTLLYLVVNEFIFLIKTKDRNF